jgi:drug/metabolite transporter (DMT)-like permease
VNPVVAVILGWLILHERVDRFIVAGSVIIIVAVVLVTRAKVKAHAPASDNQLAVSEAGARVK